MAVPERTADRAVRMILKLEVDTDGWNTDRRADSRAR